MRKHTGGPLTGRGTQGVRLPISARSLRKQSLRQVLSCCLSTCGAQGEDSEGQGTGSRQARMLVADVPVLWPPLDNEQEQAGRCARSAQVAVRGHLRMGCTEESRTGLSMEGKLPTLLCLPTIPHQPPTPALSACNTRPHRKPAPGVCSGGLHPRGWWGSSGTGRVPAKREKEALGGLRRCTGLCPLALPKPCLGTPWGEGEAQPHWSPASSESDIISLICKVGAVEPPRGVRECPPSCRTNYHKLGGL